MSSEQLSHVVDVLTTQAGYAIQPRLVSVADVEFEFDAILRGPGDGESVVIVMDGDESRIPLAISRMRALSHTMLRSGSTRPLTLVLLTEESDSASLRELATICRVIQVKGVSSDAVADELRALLPLKLPEPTTPQADAGRLLRSALGDLTSDPFVGALLAAARRDTDAVQQEVQKAITAAIADNLDEVDS